MATYDFSAVSDTAIAHKKGITLQQGRALRDNPLAMFEGASGAPRLALGALERLVEGSTILSAYDDAVSTSSTAYQTVAQWGFMQSGTVRITFGHRDNSATSDDSQARVTRVRAGNSVEMNAWSTSSDTYQDRSIDVAVQPGDEIRIQHRLLAGIGSSQIREMRLRGSASSTWWPAPLGISRA